MPIEVRRYGEAGPAVWVLHGGPGAPGGARPLAEGLAPRWRVAEPLQRRSTPGSPLTVAGHVDDLRAVVDAPVAVVGWSWGAMLGLTFAARYPDLVRSLVLVGCGTFDEESREVYARTMAERTGDEDRRRLTQIGAALPTAPVEARDRLLAERGAIAGRLQAYDPRPVRPGPELPADAVGHEETWNDVLRLQREGIQPSEFAAITGPVLMLHGTADPHPGPRIRDVLRERVPQLEYVELERCGHTPWDERHAREQFFAVLEDWLAAR